MPDDDPAPTPQQMSRRDETMAELGLTPTELTNAEGETVVVYVKEWTQEVGKNEV